jgi:hypothetical protein
VAYVKTDASGSAEALAASAESAEIDDAAAMQLLAATDEASIAQLAVWLKTNARTFSPDVLQVIQETSGLSAEAACAVLDALTWRASADAETTIELMNACLEVIAERVTLSVRDVASGTLSELDDSLVSSAVAVLTANRRSSQSEAAICCLAAAGPGGTLILARAFDAVRSTLKLYIVRRLDPADVLLLGDNVVASLAHSVSKLAEELESPKCDVATRFVAELGPIQHMEPAKIGEDEPLGVGDRVFHASWGAGVVVATNDESATIDFGGSGTRTLLRSLATLRRV